MRVNAPISLLGRVPGRRSAACWSPPTSASSTRPALADALRLWPLAVVAIGLGLVLRRTQLRVPGADARRGDPRPRAGCRVRGRSAVRRGLRRAGGAWRTSRPTQGTFDGPATVSVRSGCGSLDVTTAPGNGWRLMPATPQGARRVSGRRRGRCRSTPSDRSRRHVLRRRSRRLGPDAPDERPRAPVAGGDRRPWPRRPGRRPTSTSWP